MGRKCIPHEPEMGIGLWDYYNHCKKVREGLLSRRQYRGFEQDNIAVSEFIVLCNGVLSGEKSLKANFPDGLSLEAIVQAVED